VTPESLSEHGLVTVKPQNKNSRDGTLSKALTVKAHGFSAKAKEKIEAPAQGGADRASCLAVSKTRRAFRVAPPLFFTLAMLAVVPPRRTCANAGHRPPAMAAFFEQQKNTLFGFLNLFSGGPWSSSRVP